MKFKITKTPLGYKIGVSYSQYNPFCMTTTYSPLFWDVENGKYIVSSEGMIEYADSKEEAKQVIKSYIKSRVIITIDEEESIAL